MIVFASMSNSHQCPCANKLRVRQNDIERLRQATMASVSGNPSGRYSLISFFIRLGRTSADHWFSGRSPKPTTSVMMPISSETRRSKAAWVNIRCTKDCVNGWRAGYDSSRVAQHADLATPPRLVEANSAFSRCKLRRFSSIQASSRGVRPRVSAQASGVFIVAANLLRSMSAAIYTKNHSGYGGMPMKLDRRSLLLKIRNLAALSVVGSSGVVAFSTQAHRQLQLF